MTIDWNDAPKWANAVIADAFENLFWVEGYGIDAKRQEFGMTSPDEMTADTSQADHHWVLIESRPEPLFADGE